MSPAWCGELPQPDGYRGSGEPVWHAHVAAVSQTEPYNRADGATPTVTLAGIAAGQWTLPDAQRLALAILAAVDWTSEATARPQYTSTKP